MLSCKCFFALVWSCARFVLTVVATRDSYKDVFFAVVGGSNILGNLTGGISEALGL
jgi:hypothetical protein